MSPPTAGFADATPTHRRRCVLDASVLYQELIRNLLLWIAAEGGLDPFWTERILDEKDRHVLAAAVAGNVELVITSNLRHFDGADLDKVRKQAMSPDQLLCELLATEPTVIHAAMERLVMVMRIPRPWSIPELLGRLAGLGHGDAIAPRFAKAAVAKLDIEMAVPPERQDTSDA
jgi:hypothetical protein